MREQAQSQAFTVGPLGWGWGLLCGLAAGGLMTMAATTDQKIGMMIGTVVGTLLFSFLIGWIFWQGSGRREGGGRVAFALVALLATLGQAAHFAYKSSFRGTVQAMAPALEATTAQMLREAANPDLQRADVANIVSRLDRQLDQQTRTVTSGSGRKLVAVVREVRRMIASNELGYAAAIQEFSRADVLNFSALAGVSDVRKRRQFCQLIVDQSQRYREYLDTTTHMLKQRLAAAQIESSDSRDFAEGFDGAMSAARRQVTPLIDSQEKYAASLILLFDNLEANAAHWQRAADGKLEFADDAALAEFQSIAEKVDALQGLLQKTATEFASSNSKSAVMPTKINGAR